MTGAQTAATEHAHKNTFTSGCTSLCICPLSTELHLLKNPKVGDDVLAKCNPLVLNHANGFYAKQTVNPSGERGAFAL